MLLGRFFEGLGRFGVRGEFLRWFPPCSSKGLLGAELERFAIHPGISSDLVFIDGNMFLGQLFEGLGRFGVRGEFLMWLPLDSLKGL